MRNACAVFVCLVIASTARFGVVRADSLQARDGRTLQGEIRLETGQFIVRAAGGAETKVDAANVARAVFAPPDAPATQPATRPVEPLPGHGVRAEYYSNHYLANRPLTRIDPAIDFDWGSSSPTPFLATDFSARWSGQLEPQYSETYTFYTRTDNGVRLWIDGKLLVDKSLAKSTVPGVGTAELHAGRKYDFRMEYGGLGSTNVAQLAWSSPSQPRQAIPNDRLYPAPARALGDGKPHGLKAEFYSSRDIMDRGVRLIRLEPDVNIYWSHDEMPDPSVGHGSAIRWTGKVEPRFSETYTFIVRALGARLWIDGRPLINDASWETKEHLGTIDLTAGRKYDLRLEVGNAWDRGMAQFSWLSPSEPRQIIPTDRLTPPDDFALPPALRLISPADGTQLVAVRRVMLEASAAPAARPSTAPSLSSSGAVEFFDNGRLIGQASAAPYRFAWEDVPSGYHHLTARLAGDAKVVSSADARFVVIGNGDGTLPSPWLEQRLGHRPRPSKEDPGVQADRVRFSDGVFTVAATRGAPDGALDACHLVYQRLVGDGDIVAHVAELAASPNGATALAGVTFRNGTEPSAPSACLWLTEDRQAVFTYRTSHGSAHQRATTPAATATWVKIERRGKKLNAFIADDGVQWQPVGTGDTPLGEEALVGLIACGSLESDCTARFDRVSITRGAPKLEIPSGGIVTISGSYIVGAVHRLENGKASFLRAGDSKGISLPGDAISRIICRPLTKAQADQLASGKTGVLLASGDFVDADIQLVTSSEVQTDSVLFGPRQFHVATQVAGIGLHGAPAAAPAAFRITTADGSVFMAKSIDVGAGILTVNDEAAGAFTIPLDDLREIQAPRP